MGKEASILKKLEKVLYGKHNKFDDIYKWQDSIVLVNTCYDMQLVENYELLSESYTIEGKNVTIIDSIKFGNQAITNRKDLYDFLKTISQFDYKYVFLDIQLPKISDSTHYDDSLKYLLLKMNNVCVPNSELFVLDSVLTPISGWADYRTSLKDNGFVKYPLLIDDKASVALKMDNNRSIKPFANIMYLDGKSLCQNSITISFFDFSLKNTSENIWEGNSDNIRRYIDLATDDWRNIEESTVSNKIIVIGDLFSNDIHDTFAGKQSGALIHLNALLNIINGKHLVNWWIVIMLFIVYFITTYCIMSKKTLMEFLAEKPLLHSILSLPLVRFVLSFVSWWMVFMGVSIILYRFAGGYYYSLFLPSIWFAILPHSVQYYEELTKQKIH